jgi:hypothetical protein
MTAKEIRDIGFIAWENDLAWMEKMQGTQWKDLLRKERKIWNSIASVPHVRHLSREFLKEFEDYIVPYTRVGNFVLCDGLLYVLIHKGTYYWRWAWQKKQRKALNLYSDGNYVWIATTDNESKVAYKSALICEDRDRKIIWKKNDTSQDFYVKDNICYYIRTNYPFETSMLCSCNANTGKGERVIYRENDPQRFINLIPRHDSQIFFNSTSWMDSKLYYVSERSHTPKRLFTDTSNQIVLDRDNFLLIPNGRREYIRHGKEIKSWIFPPDDYYPTWINIRTGHMLTMRKGEQILWYCESYKKPIRVYSISAGDFLPSPWWIDETIVSQFTIYQPEELPCQILVSGKRILEKRTASFKSPAKLPESLISVRRSATSADGTDVPFLIVHEKSKRPTKLLGYIYGAYGSPTLVSWPSMGWYPLLKRGWAIVYAFPRGGGDNGPVWMEEGQRNNHIKTIEDFEAVIRSAQNILKISPDRSAIYGRSAGGMMVGATTARNPDGHLIGATFAEVPFVDILRTQTNPQIPLTQSGYSEYGNPLASVRNFEALLRISPMNSLPDDGAPGLFVLCRTGLLDLQVLPFEPFKWIMRLRGKREPPAGKFLSFEEDEAHVYGEKNGIPSRALDLAILESWAEKKLSPNYL